MVTPEAQVESAILAQRDRLICHVHRLAAHGARDVLHGGTAASGACDDALGRKGLMLKEVDLTYYTSLLVSIICIREDGNLEVQLCSVEYFCFEASFADRVCTLKYYYDTLSHTEPRPAEAAHDDFITPSE